MFVVEWIVSICFARHKQGSIRRAPRRAQRAERPLDTCRTHSQTTVARTNRRVRLRPVEVLHVLHAHRSIGSEFTVQTGRVGVEWTGPATVDGSQIVFRADAVVVYACDVRTVTDTSNLRYSRVKCGLLRSYASFGLHNEIVDHDLRAGRTPQFERDSSRPAVGVVVAHIPLSVIPRPGRGLVVAG
jgi:hypothetical protein